MPRKLIPALAAVLALCACGKQPPAAPDKGVLNLYTARHYDADLQIYAAFTKATGIKVNRLEMPSDQLIERMKAEADASPADVILMPDAGALARAADAKLFQPYNDPTLAARVPANLRDADGNWQAFSQRARVVAYDRAKVKPEEVATYEALATPRFRHGVCARSSDNEYNLSLMASFIEHWGREKSLAWAKGVVANFARPPQGGDIDEIRAVGAGACEVALTNTYYYLRIAASPAPDDKATTAKVALAFPEQGGYGTHVNVSGGGIAAHAPHKDAAQKFLDFLTSDEAQLIFSNVNHEFPVVASVKMPADVEAISHFKADPLPVSSYGKFQPEAQKVYDEAEWR